MSCQKTYITLAATTTIGSGVQDVTLCRVVINKATTGAITLSDNAGAFAVIAASTPAQTMEYDVAIQGTLTVVNAQAENLTVCTK